MVVESLEGMAVGLSVVEALLAEVKIGTDLAVVPRTLDGLHGTAVAPGQWVEQRVTVQCVVTYEGPDK